MSNLGKQPAVEQYHSIDLENPGDIPTHSPPTSHMQYQPMPDPISDSYSVHSTVPLNTGYKMDTIPPMPEPSAARIVEPSPSYLPRYPPNRQDSYADSNHSAGASAAGTGPGGFVRLKDRENEKSTRPHHPRNQSWDFLSGITKDIDGFDTRNASQAHLQFAEGDIPKNRLVRFYTYLLNLSIVTRWFLYIVPVVGLLWIPGILQITTFHTAHIWGVYLKWWSIWFTVCWVGWWAALAVAMAMPVVLRNTLGVVAVGLRRYIEWLTALQRYIAFFAWTLAQWIAFTQLIVQNQPDLDPNDPGAVARQADNAGNLQLIQKILFGLMLCAAILLGEKFAIQWIAYKFHERSYAERIAAQKIQTGCLTTLYKYSSEIPGRSDTLKDSQAAAPSVINPKKLLRGVIKGVKGVASHTTTALGNVASEIAGSSVLQPNSPAAMVATALSSANKTRLLARRIFYSFVQPGANTLVITDIAQYFPDHEMTEIAFGMFDKDGNHDATRDEVEIACLEVHRERLALANSMRDIDSAVGRLDNILMSFYFIIAALVIAVTLEAKLTTLLTGAGSLVLDRVDIDKGSYIVKEMRLLSTVFIDVTRGCLVQAPNAGLSTQFISNIQRSGPMSETFVFDVAYDTEFEQIEALRSRMLAFVQSHRRDYQPTFDIVVSGIVFSHALGGLAVLLTFLEDIPGQEKMTLKADILYKSNWQQGALKTKRRNKWMCALKTAMAELKVYGPTGDPSAKPGPTKYTQVPWEEVKEMERTEMPLPDLSTNEPRIPRGEWSFTDQDAMILDRRQDVFDEADDYSFMPTAQTRSGQDLRQRRMTRGVGETGEAIEMSRSRASMPRARQLLHAPLSKRDDNKVPTSIRVDRKPPKARPSLMMVSVEIPVKGSSSSKLKNKVQDQNVEPTPENEDRTLKRKRSISDPTNNSIVDTKKKGPERGQSNKKILYWTGPDGEHRHLSKISPLKLWCRFRSQGGYPSPRMCHTMRLCKGCRSVKLSHQFDRRTVLTNLQLREFLARFQPLTKLAQVHLDTLSRISIPTRQYIPRVTLKAVLLALVDLVGADAPPKLRQGCQTALRHIRNAKGDLAITWDALSELRETCYSELPNPDHPPITDSGVVDDEIEDENEDQGRVTRQASRLSRASQPSPPPKDDSFSYQLVCGGQFLPILVFLAELALQTPSVRADVDYGMRSLSVAAHKTHTTKLAEEKSRWNDQRQKFASVLTALQSTRSQEKEAANAQGTRTRGSPTAAKIKDIKSKRKAADADHQRILRKLSISYNLELRACAGRGTYLGSDQSGRQYFALALAPKSTRNENRWDYWSTFISCWGPEADGMDCRWYGFDDPSEIRLLASVLEHGIGRGPSLVKDKDPLIKSLLSYAEFLDDRITIED
ncbi:serine/threonine protein kinase [Rhizoctonia solani AG-1 IA]|uniref:Serine/threonine protein kinase n=1 Tax=Thanatephorus cucumeris (strain AG1-IA) TaxID=983506 RepID=L8WWK7_THACA|nr:serine/threonine protein kinase [Rhizoctonia solani AG-1 IA]